MELKTSTRVALSMTFLAALLAALMAISLVRMNALTSDIDALASTRVPKIILGARGIETLLQSARHKGNVLVSEDDAEIRKEAAAITDNATRLAGISGQVDGLVADSAERRLLDAIAAARAAHAPLEKQFLDLVDKGLTSSAKDLMTRKLRAVETKYVDAMSEFVAFQASAIESDSRATHEAQVRTSALMVSLTVIALAIALAATIAVTLGIRHRFGERSYAASVARAIASGDLTQRVEARKGDDAAVLAAMRKMRDDLASTVGSIRTSAESVGRASRQIASGSAELAGRTEEQASSLEETAASMEELASTVKQTADNAVHADGLADTAASLAERGGAEVGRVVDTMATISQSSSRIADIISVIDGIAFQTNILALNAAVEAARAGEEGRGFAVVAAEVRALAHRSADAAKEIKSLIGESVERVDAGTRLVEQAGATIGTLVTHVKQVRELMRSIAEASAEQSRGVQQVNKTVTEMDKVVQQNAHAVHETAQAAEAMRAQADRLLETVGSFRLSAESAAAPVQPAVMSRDIVALASTKTTLARAKPGITARSPSDDEDWKEF